MSNPSTTPLSDEALVDQAAAQPRGRHHRPGPRPDGDLRWHLPFSPSWWTAGSSPAPVGDIVIVADRTDQVFGVDAVSGEPRWQTTVGAGAHASPDIAGDLALVATGRSFHPSEREPGELFCLDVASGRVHWTFKAPGEFCGDPIVFDDRVIIGGNDGAVRAISLSDGVPIWHVETSGFVTGAAKSLDGQSLWIGSWDGGLRRIDVTSGAILATVDLGEEIERSVALDASTVAAVTVGGILICMDPSGRERWSCDLGGDHASAPALADGRLYIGGCDPNDVSAALLVFDAKDGELLHVTPADGWISGGPAVVDRRCYFGTSEGDLRAIDAQSGDACWTIRARSGTFADPVVRDGRVYFTCQDACYCVG